jgi:hypothetical protein
MINMTKSIWINHKLFQVEKDTITVPELCRMMHIPTDDVLVYMNDAPFPIPNLQLEVTLNNNDNFEIMRNQTPLKLSSYKPKY